MLCYLQGIPFTLTIDMAEIVGQICSILCTDYFSGRRKANQGSSEGRGWCRKRHGEEEANTAATLERTEATQLRDTQVQPTGTAPMQENSHRGGERVVSE